MGFKTVYEETNLNRESPRSVSENVECEIVIVGGGLAGLSLAYELAERGQSFILIEAERIGKSAA